MYFKNNHLNENVLKDPAKLKEWQENLLKTYSIDLNKDKEWNQLSDNLKEDFEKNNSLFSDDKDLNESILPQSGWWSGNGTGPFDWIKHSGKIFGPLKWLAGLLAVGLFGVLYSVFGIVKAGNKALAIRKLKNYLNRIVALADAGWKNKKNLSCLLNIERNSRKEILIQTCELLRSAGFSMNIEPVANAASEKAKNPLNPKENNITAEENGNTNTSDIDNKNNNDFISDFKIPSVDGVDWSLVNNEKADSGWLNWGILIPFKDKNKGTNAIQMIQNTADLGKSALENSNNDIDLARKKYIISLSSVYSKSLGEILGSNASTIISKDIKNQMIYMAKNASNIDNNSNVENGGNAAPPETNFYESSYNKYKHFLFEEDDIKNTEPPVNNDSGKNIPWTDDPNKVWILNGMTGNRYSINKYLQMGNNFSAIYNIFKKYNTNPDSVKFDIATIFNINNKSVNISYFDENPDKIMNFFTAMQTILPLIGSEIGYSQAFKGSLQITPQFQMDILKKVKNKKNNSDSSKIVNNMNKTGEYMKRTVKNETSEQTKGYIGFAEREGQVFTGLFKSPQNLVCYQATHKQMEVFLTQLDTFITNTINRVVPQTINYTKDTPISTKLAHFFIPRAHNGKENNGLTMLWKGNYLPVLQRRMNLRSGNVISSHEMEFYRQIVENLIPEIIEKNTTGQLSRSTTTDINQMNT